MLCYWGTSLTWDPPPSYTTKYRAILQNSCVNHYRAPSLSRNGGLGASIGTYSSEVERLIADIMIRFSVLVCRNVCWPVSKRAHAHC